MVGTEGIIVDAVEVTLVTAIGVQEVRVVTVALEDANLEVIQETEETRGETGAEAGLGEVVATIRMREVEVTQEETEVTQERSAAILEKKGAEVCQGEVQTTQRMREVALKETGVTREKSAAPQEKAEARATRVISQGPEVEANPADLKISFVYFLFHKKKPRFQIVFKLYYRVFQKKVRMFFGFIPSDMKAT